LNTSIANSTCGSQVLNTHMIAAFHSKANSWQTVQRYLSQTLGKQTSRPKFALQNSDFQALSYGKNHEPRA
jgi:AICAR transformylase/IMP cyclohydrolase PurH